MSEPEIQCSTPTLAEYRERTRAAYAAEAARIRAELIELVSDAIYADAGVSESVRNTDHTDEAVADTCDRIAEVAVDTVAEFFNRQQPFVETQS